MKPILIRRQVVGKLKEYIRERHKRESPEQIHERSVKDYYNESNINFAKTLERGNGGITTSVTR